MAKNATGFTLIELMIAVAILAVIAGIAIPVYNGYIRESRLGAMRMNLETLRIAVEAHRIEEGTYRDTIAPAATDPYDEVEISSVYGWRPEGGEAYSYFVSGVNSTVYNLVAEEGTTWWVRCEKNPDVDPAFKCCAYGDTGATKDACP